MSKEKESYYDWIKLHALCGHSLSKNVTDYVEKLENLNKQMLEALIMIYKIWHEDSILISSTKPIIESITGKKIEEVIK